MNSKKWGGLTYEAWLVVADGEGKGKLVLFQTQDPDEAMSMLMRARRLGYGNPRILRKAVECLAAEEELL